MWTQPRTTNGFISFPTSERITIICTDRARVDVSLTGMSKLGIRVLLLHGGGSGSGGGGTGCRL
jgi:hypothetical protein